MRREAAEAPDVLLRRLSIIPEREHILGSQQAIRAIYTIARGSSDAAATVFNYEAMAQLGLPATTLPPSVFSLGPGLDLRGSLVVLMSQSGGSTDLIASAEGAMKGGARVVAITNVDHSDVEKHAHHRLPILAGPELAVPATKSVVGAISAGISLLAALSESFAQKHSGALDTLRLSQLGHLENSDRVVSAISEAKHIYVIGRKQMLGAAQEVALKIKECCCIHAESYSASEVIHGPLQLSGPQLLVLILDDGDAILQPGLDSTEASFTGAGAHVIRLRTEMSKIKGSHPCGSLLAADMLIGLYPHILEAALRIGADPDRPNLLNKVTRTT